jgi:hypothetical protein
MDRAEKGIGHHIIQRGASNVHVVYFAVLGLLKCASVPVDHSKSRLKTAGRNYMQIYMDLQNAVRRMRPNWVKKKSRSRWLTQCLPGARTKCCLPISPRCTTVGITVLRIGRKYPCVLSKSATDVRGIVKRP